jgi:hypothetical protein
MQSAKSLYWDASPVQLAIIDVQYAEQIAVPPSSDDTTSLPAPESPPTSVVASAAIPPLMPELATLVPALAPLTVPALMPLLVPELLPLPATPLAWPPQATTARSRNATGGRRYGVSANSSVTVRG